MKCIQKYGCMVVKYICKCICMLVILGQNSHCVSLIVQSLQIIPYTLAFFILFMIEDCLRRWSVILRYWMIANIGQSCFKLLPFYWKMKLSHPKTHSQGMTVISHLKPKGSKWKWYRHSFYNWKLLIIKFSSK